MKNYNKLETYDESQILCILSCFYSLKVKDDYKTFVPPFMKHEMEYMDNLVKKYIDRELSYNLYITCHYELQYDLMERIKIWYNNVDNEEKSYIFSRVNARKRYIYW